MYSANFSSIINFLLNSNDYVTSSTIGSHIHKSIRTVKREIENINAILPEYGAIIESKKKLGYRLQINNQNNFRALLRSMGSRFNNNSNELQYKRKLVDYFVFNTDRVTIQDISDVLFVNETTALKTIKLLNNDLQSYHAKIMKTDDCYYLNNDEISKRCLLLELLSFNYHYHPKDKDYSQTFLDYFERDNHDLIRNNLFSCMLSNNIHPYHFLYDKIINYLVLARNRYKNGYQVFLNKKQISLLLSSTEYQCAKQLCQNLAIEWSESETVLLAAVIMSCENTKFSTYQSNQNVFMNEAEKITSDIIAILKNKYEFDASFSTLFHESMVSILIPVICANKYNLASEVSFSKTKRIYPDLNNPLARSMMMIVFNYLKEKYGYTCSLQLLSQILIIFVILLNEIHFEHKKINLCISTDLNVNYKRTALFEIVENFTDYIENFYLINFYEINEFLDRSDILIVELRYLENYSVPVPVYYYTTANYNTTLKQALKDAVLNTYNLDNLASYFSQITSFYSNLNYLTLDNFQDVLAVKYGDNSNIEFIHNSFRQNDYIMDENLAFYFYLLPLGKHEFVDFYLLSDKNSMRKYVIVSSLAFTNQKIKVLTYILNYLNINSSFIDELFQGKDAYTSYLEILKDQIKSYI